jgi:hypothetical protein
MVQTFEGVEKLSIIRSRDSFYVPVSHEVKNASYQWNLGFDFKWEHGFDNDSLFKLTLSAMGRTCPHNLHYNMSLVHDHDQCQLPQSNLREALPWPYLFGVRCDS